MHYRCYFCCIVNKVSRYDYFLPLRVFLFFAYIRYRPHNMRSSKALRNINANLKFKKEILWLAIFYLNCVWERMGNHKFPPIIYFELITKLTYTTITLFFSQLHSRRLVDFICALNIVPSFEFHWLLRMRHSFWHSFESAAINC